MFGLSDRLKRWLVIPAAFVLALALGACGDIDPNELDNVDVPIEDTVAP